MKVSHKLAKLIKNLYLSKQYGARSLLSELSDKETWKYWQSAEENPHDGYSPAIPGRGGPRSRRISWRPCVQ